MKRLRLIEGGRATTPASPRAVTYARLLARIAFAGDTGVPVLGETADDHAHRDLHALFERPPV